MSEKERLLNPEDLPTSLWDAVSQTLSLPPSLARAYEGLIDRHNLRTLANCRNSDNPPIGGLGQESTDQHFAQAFDGSAARAQLAILDPNKDVTPVSNDYVKSLAGNTLSLTDSPCGAGAAVLAILANTAELRASRVIPREPLDVFLIGAELSEPARVYAKALLAELRPFLEKQAIFVTSEFISWDVTDVLSNTDLIRKMTIQAEGRRNHLLIVANFNAFLEKEKKRKEAHPQLSELFRHASRDHSVVMWIEPNMNRATGDGGLFSWLRKTINQAWRRFAKEKTDANIPILTSNARFCLPLKPGETARVTLGVMPIDLARTK